MELVVDGEKYRLAVEVKSTTKGTVSTARDVSIEHIGRWRSMFFVIGFYTREARHPELVRSLCLTPNDLEPWISSIADKIEPDFKIARLASRRLELGDMFDVCGTKPGYTIGDARRLHKKQWSVQEYKAAVDMPGPRGGLLSPERMLELLRLRSRYIAERGATLNNPHIPKTFLEQFSGTSREVLKASQASDAMRQLAASFIRANPQHPAVVRIGSG